MKIQTIEESEFNKIDCSRKIIVNEHSHAFGVVDLGTPLGCYGIGWRTHIIEPVVELSPDGFTLWVGVDQRLAAIDMQQGNIRVAMPLIGILVQILIGDNFTAVLTELEVILFNNSSCSLRSIAGLPDLSEDISFNGSDFIIKLFDGPSLMLNPHTGKFKESPEEYFAQRDRLEAEKSKKSVSAV